MNRVGHSNDYSLRSFREINSTKFSRLGLVAESTFYFRVTLVSMGDKEKNVYRYLHQLILVISPLILSLNKTCVLFPYLPLSNSFLLLHIHSVMDNMNALTRLIS